MCVVHGLVLTVTISSGWTSEPRQRRSLAREGSKPRGTLRAQAIPCRAGSDRIEPDSKSLPTVGGQRMCRCRLAKDLKAPTRMLERVLAMGRFADHLVLRMPDTVLSSLHVSHLLLKTDCRHRYLVSSCFVSPTLPSPTPRASERR
ncbi:hypothetical protein BHM03_00026955 [Ensete ventricosum]|uniref:Uncharacterized protein n=1 Tax=Ensete ventricosum TaxID=4639 RepID=A0A445MHF1_ENSVE|nr:hypothetical protein BHM03_00026955 [Ensete ventricosum]